MGPNGSGKTTLLECIAGIRRIESGKIELNRVDITSLPPEKRRVGYVPQDCLLFPHLTVDQNIAFGERSLGKNAKSELRQIMEWLSIPHLVGRDAMSLSGGEKQKVALARALMTHPQVLLLDEPLSKVDRATRTRLQEEMRKALDESSARSGLTTLYVTHDLAEAQLMTDQVAIMNNGRVEQVGSWDRVLQAPNSTFVADFMGFNVLRGHLVSVEEDFAVAQVDGQSVRGVGNGLIQGESVVLVVRPETILLSHGKENAKASWRHCQCNVFEGSITGIRKMGSVTRVSLDVGFPLNSETSSDQIEELGLAVGDRVFAHFRASEVGFLRP